MEGENLVTPSEPNTSAPETQTESTKEPTFRESLEKKYDELESADKGEAPKEAAVEVQEEEEKAVEEPAIAPPVGMDSEARELFAKLPRDLQTKMSEHYTQSSKAIARKFTEVDLMRQQLQPVAELNDMIQPYLKNWELNGAPPAAVIKQLLTAQDFIESDPVQGIQWLMSTYGITPEVLIGQQNSFSDPTYQLKQEIDQLKEQLQHQEFTRTEQQDSAYLRTLDQEVSNFEREVDSVGSPAYPLFQEVQNDMLPIVQLLKSQYPDESNRRILHEAYDRAVYANPTTRGRVMTQRAREEQAKRYAETKAKSDQAQRASTTLRQTGNAVITADPVNLRETLEQAYDQIVNK